MAVREQAITGISNVSNDGEMRIIKPFSVAATIQGVADFLFHRWSDDEVEAKAKAAKGSKAKKTDNVESYVYRDDHDFICIPGRYLQRSIVEAARFHQDPRSPRKSAKDLTTAGVVVTPLLSPMLVNGKPTKEWDYLDRQRVVVQRNAITRQRPAFRAGWQAKFEATSLLPEYITEDLLRRLIDDSGRFVGLGDFRPQYGRFVVTAWSLLS